MATQKLLSSLSEADFQLILGTEPAELSALDEDALLDLHARVRRVRNKRGSEANAARAEIFEEALARVSRQLATAAAQSARALKEERLAQVRRDSPAPAKAAGTPRSAGVKKRVLTDKTRQSPGRKKREAGSIAAGARRQAKRDSR